MKIFAAKRILSLLLLAAVLIQLPTCTVPVEVSIDNEAADETAAAETALPGNTQEALAETEAPTERPSPDPTDEPKEQATEQPTEKPTPAPTAAPTATPAPTAPPTDTPRPTANPKYPYLLYVEKGSFTLTIYGIGSDGQYSKAVKRYRISHGGNRTPAGTYVLGRREHWHPFSGGDNGYAQYAVMYNTKSNPDGWSGLFVHGPMYHSQDPNDLWIRYYDGEKAIGGENTQGCLRMVVEAAKFIYDNCPKGTTLKIVNGSPRNTKSKDVPARNGLKHDPTDKGAADKP